MKLQRLRCPDAPALASSAPRTDLCVVEAMEGEPSPAEAYSNLCRVVLVQRLKAP